MPPREEALKKHQCDKRLGEPAPLEVGAILDCSSLFLRVLFYLIHFQEPGTLRLCDIDKWHLPNWATMRSCGPGGDFASRTGTVCRHVLVFWLLFMCSVSSVG